MAQDVRPYKSKEQDGNGNEIILRDQQLVEQTSKTTMASGEYFEIVDVDGRMAKIPKDNMIGVVREALGSLLNGLADQTTVTKALTLNGDTLGASTAATLASVLGGTDMLPAKSTLALASSKVAKIKLNQGFNAIIVGNGWQSGLYFEMVCNGYSASALNQVVLENGTGCSLYKSTMEPCTFYVLNNSIANKLYIGVIMAMGTLNSLTQIDSLPSDATGITV